MQSITTKDAPAIADMDMLLFPDNSFNERTLAREIEAGGGVVIYKGDELVGYLLARWDLEIMDIIRVGVLPEYQCKGHGTKMLFDALSSTKLDVILCVAKDNKGAIKLYLLNDFFIIGQINKNWVMRRST